MDRLPPAVSIDPKPEAAAADGVDMDEKPRRRLRRPRPDAVTVEA